MFKSFENGPHNRPETEQKPKSPETLDVHRVGPEEGWILARFYKGKAGHIARVLTLLTSLIMSSGSFEKVSAEEEKESPKIEQAEIQETKIKEDYYHLEFQEGAEASAEIIDNINYVCFSIINNGEAKPIILSAAELKKSPYIKIDGYIVNILIFGKRAFNISLNHRKAEQFNEFKKGSLSDLKDLFSRRCDGEPSLQLLLNKTIQDAERGKSVASNAYLFFSSVSRSYHGSPISDVKNNVLTFKAEDKIYNISIRQEIFREFKKMNGRTLRYLGNNFEKFSKIEGLTEKLQKITDGINGVEALFNTHLINYIDVIDYVIDNAFIYDREEGINFSIDYLENNSGEIMQSTAEHETLHRYDVIKWFADDIKIRALFADLKGYNGEKKDRIINRGYIPFDNFNNEYDNQAFFAFVNEDNFLGHNNDSGHSQSSIGELCASFIHSLMYLDKLEKNLELQISIPEDLHHEKKERLLTKEEKVEILNSYVRVLQVLLETNNLTKKEKTFFKAKLDHVEKIKKKYEQQPQ